MKPIVLTPATAAGAAVAAFLAVQAGGIAADRAGMADLAQALACDVTGVLLIAYGVGLAAFALQEVGAAIADGAAKTRPMRLFENRQTA